MQRLRGRVSVAETSEPKLLREKMPLAITPMVPYIKYADAAPRQVDTEQEETPASDQVAAQ